MKEAFIRTEALLGPGSIETLNNKNVLVFGVGGVGSYVAEVLGRSGLGKLTIVDYDNIEISNINRQIHANMETIGKSKVLTMKERLLKINPDMEVKAFNEKYNRENNDFIEIEDYDYVVDAIDMVTSKLMLAELCHKKNIKIISAMGAGNKLDPTRIILSDIYETKECPLARVMRRELRKRDVSSLKVAWSDEKPIKLEGNIPGTVGFVPSVMGLIIGGEVIKELVKKGGNHNWNK